MASGERFLERLDAPDEAKSSLREAYQRARESLCGGEPPYARIVTAGYEAAHALCAECVKTRSALDARQLRLDRALAGKWIGIPLLLCLLALVFYLTLIGANAPSAWLSALFERLYGPLRTALAGAPPWLASLLMDGVYRVTTWVVAVMLPPMAIFFPLFTLLEDFGFLPRVAFNLDRCFKRCDACGKQALCMMQGLGCNAVGVTGCRIIQSPRERMVAVLTNSMIPCNGRLPTLITLATLFFLGGGAWASALSALYLAGTLALAVGVTLLCSRLLTRTVLRGMPSAFSLELPPFRRPHIRQVLVRSLLDRTLFVLGRAATVAAPAGLILWLLANLRLGDASVLSAAAGALNPLGRLLGMDGALLLGFILGFPANEIVLPITLMIYLAEGTLVDAAGVTALREILVANGWTVWTAVCATLFSLFHWPCSTTLWTIAKETKSARWTLLAAALPTLVGAALCFLVECLHRLVG